MKQINDRGEESSKLAKSTLIWVACSKKPLTKWELQHALAIEVESSDLDEDNFVETDDLSPYAPV
jgi:hypothetical protein